VPEHSVIVNRPVAEVFAYAAALDRHAEWQPDLLKAEVLSSGPIGVGATAAETRKVMGRVQRFEYRITEWEQDRLLAFVTTNGRVRPEGEMTFAADGEATRVGFSIVPKGAGAGRLMLRLAGRAIERSIDANMARFKEKLESDNA
jgi:uncharacterized membrane protein